MVNIRDRKKRGAGRDKVGAFDFYVRRSKTDFLFASWIDCQERNIPSSGLQSFNHFSGRIKGNQLERQIGPSTKFARQIDGDAPKLSGVRISRRQHGVSIVDADAQCPCRREIKMKRG
jgi:hypothetical protein